MLHESRLYKVLHKNKCLYGAMVIAVRNLIRRSWVQTPLFVKMLEFLFLPTHRIRIGILKKIDCCSSYSIKDSPILFMPSNCVKPFQSPLILPRSWNKPWRICPWWWRSRASPSCCVWPLFHRPPLQSGPRHFLCSCESCSSGKCNWACLYSNT